MKLSPQGYKRLVRVAQCVEDFDAWNRAQREHIGTRNAKAVFKNKWPTPYLFADKGHRYEDVFRQAILEITQGKLDGPFASAFMNAKKPKG